MELNGIPDFTQYLEDWFQELEILRQNHLLGEIAFVEFARDRGIDICRSDFDNLRKRGLLSNDGEDYCGAPLFHPFRIYPISQTIKACKLGIAASASLQRESFLKVAELAVSSLPSLEQIEEASRQRNRVTDLAILLEPVYWRYITHSEPSKGAKQAEYESLLEQYCKKMLDLVGSLEPGYWRNKHVLLRQEAERIDHNSGLYLLIRLMPWQKREQLKGNISCALWIRHIAEVIRQAFEQVYDAERWAEEDEFSRTWRPPERIMFYGSERPLDNEGKSKPYLVLDHGLFTGSLVRWYVEGETEYYAILHMLHMYNIQPSEYGIEMVNLKGNIASNKNNIAMKFSDALVQDKALRRFSIISFDTDVPENVKTIRRQIEQHRIVGLLTANKPDFEFANFTIMELVEIAALIDEENGFSGNPVRNADWTGISGGKAFEQRYIEISASRPSSLKGEKWGNALAAYIFKNPYRSDNSIKRPLQHEIEAALRCTNVYYDFQKNNFGFDPETFESISLQQSAT
jgi:hypothetical protein